jgi:hypothetical protein
MADKLLYDVTKFGTVIENELGIEVDDARGRQGDKIITRLHPTSAGGGGQSSQIIIMNRYRPGNRYRYVRANGTITQFNSVKADIAFATEADRDANIINTDANDTLGNVVDGIAEQGLGGPLTTDPALTSHPAGTFMFITVRGKAIANVNAAVVAADVLGPDPATAGRLSTLAVTTPTAAETRRITNAASGLGIRALVNEPPTGFKANLTWVKLT